MSYATKYKVEWIDYFDQSAELLIEEQGYGGASTDIKGTRSPISLAYDTPSDFLFEPINGSSMTIRLVAQTDFEFVDLHTANNRKYRVTLNIDSALFWQGYLLPDRYQEEYKGPPYVNEFVAADQLGYLKTLAWSNTSTLNEKEALEIILTATDLDFDLQEGLNIYEVSYNSTAADSPLNQTYFDAGVFDGKTYYEVLYNILFKYNAILKQRAGEWFIFRPREATTSYTLRKWTYSLGVYTYDSNQSYNPVVSTTSATVAEASLVRILSGTMFINPAWKKYKLTHNLGLLEAFNDNYDFSSWSGTDPNRWTKSGVFTHTRWYNGVKINANTSHNLGVDFFRSYTVFSGDTTATQGIKISLDISVYIPGNTDITLYFRIGINGAPYYDIETNTWISTLPFPVTQKKITNSESEFLIQYSKLEYVTAHLPLSVVNFCHFDIMAPVCSSTSAHIIVKEAKLSLIQYLGGEVTEFNDEVEYNVAIDVDNNYEPNDIELLLADIPVTSPPSYNGKNIWKGLLYEDAAKSTVTSSWNADGRTDTLIGLMQNNFVDIFQFPQQVLSVKIYTKLIDACTVLQEINNTTTSNKYFMIKRATWEAQEGYWDVEAHQLPFAVGESRIQLETEDYILLETGDKIVRE